MLLGVGEHGGVADLEEDEKMDESSLSTLIWVHREMYCAYIINCK